MLRTACVIIFLWGFGCASASGQAGSDTTSADSLAADTTAMVSRPDSVASDTAAELFEVVRWRYRSPITSERVATDSTLRWQLWPDWTYRANRRPGVITYRLGTILRSNAFIIDAHEPRHQRLFWEDIPLHDPVSGTVHWGFIPNHKISAFYSEGRGISHDSRYYLKQYYLNKPLTQLNYTESKFDYRSLEFMVSRNFSQKTNAEISYWDRRAGGEYNNSGVQGRQIFARILHLLDHRQSMKIHLLNNKYTVGQPFGYRIQDLQNFSFDRFQTGAVEPRGTSDIAATTVGLNYYLRPADSSRIENNLMAGIYFNNRSRTLDYSADSTFYRVQSFGANARKWLDLHPLTLEAGLGYEYFINKNRSVSNLQRGAWGLLTAEAEARLQPVDLFSLNGGASLRHRSDNRTAYTFRAGAALHLSDFIDLKASASRGVSIPANQQLYWNSNEFRGTRSLKNEKISSAGAELSIRPFSTLTMGFRGDLRLIEDGIMMGTDSTFTNIASYNSVSVTPYVDYQSSLLELSASATYHAYEDLFGVDKGALPLDDSPRVWLRGSAYVKGYVFDRAAYVKGGLSGMLSPYRYRAAHYNTVLDFWQPKSDDPFLPAFNRLDAEVSARVRWIIFLLRMENVLDDVNQLGYFETAGYPMSQRRFFFGIRVIFRN